jgi:hypothetical protein
VEAVRAGDKDIGVNQETSPEWPVLGVNGVGPIIHWFARRTVAPASIPDKFANLTTFLIQQQKRGLDCICPSRLVNCANI